MNALVESEIQCPHCGEFYSTMIDTSQGEHTTIEDCTVCCRPIQLTVACEPGEIFSIETAVG
jgi:hypothetical protein